MPETTSTDISAFERSDRSERFEMQLGAFSFFSQKSLLFPSLWLSTTERHSLLSSPASVGEISFNIPALWGKGRRSSLIGWAEMLPVFKTRQMHGCYWCSCLQCRFLKSALGDRQSEVPLIFMVTENWKMNFEWMFVHDNKSAVHMLCVCAPLESPVFQLGLDRIRCFRLKSSFLWPSQANIS